MRIVTALFLIGLLSACPVVCGAFEVGHDSHGLETQTGTPCDPASPVHCPPDADDCICQGAVQTVDVRVPSSADGIGLLLPFLAFSHTPPHPHGQRA